MTSKQVRDMKERIIELQGEKFVVALNDDEKSATVADDRGFKVLISINNRNGFVARPLESSGGLAKTMPEAVDLAIKYCIGAREDSQGALLQELKEYINDN